MARKGEDFKTKNAQLIRQIQVRKKKLLRGKQGQKKGLSPSLWRKPQKNDLGGWGKEQIKLGHSGLAVVGG